MENDSFRGYQEVVTEEVAFGFGVPRFYHSTQNGSLCPAGVVPSVSAYLSAINVYGITLFCFGAIAVLLVLFSFIDTLLYIMRNSRASVKAHSAFVIGVYPVVALSTFCATIVPRSHLLAEAVTQGIFMAAMYQLFCLLVAYCGGEAELIRRVKPAQLSPKVGPCCCWPCCACLPRMDISKNHVLHLRLLVLQLPVVQGLVYMTLLVMWAERESLYQINYMYVQPVIIMSILFGIWGMSMTMNLLKDVLKDHSIPAKFMVLQMVLLFAKMQGLVTRVLAWTEVLPCNPPITPAVYGNLIHSTLMLVEMVLLGFIARWLYKRDLPDPDLAVDSTVLPQICVISGNRISTIATIMHAEHVNNNSNKCNNQNNNLCDKTS